MDGVRDCLVSGELIMRIGIGLGLGTVNKNTGFSPAGLFTGAESGVWHRVVPSALFQDSTGTTPVTALGDPVGKMLDLSGHGNHKLQATAANRPILPAAGWRLRTDWAGDYMAQAGNIGNNVETWINTPYGHYRAVQSGLARPPLNDATEIIAHSALTADQRTAISSYFGTTKAYMVALSSDTTVSNLRIYTGGGTTNLLFIGANGATVTKGLSLNSDTSYDVSADGLTAPVAVVWPDVLSSSTTLQQLRLSVNALAGSPPSLAANTGLVAVYLSLNNFVGSIQSLEHCPSLTAAYWSNNQFTGTLPSVAANTALTQYYCGGNQLTGNIHSLSSNTALTVWSGYTNQFAGWDGGTVSATLGEFKAANNLLPQATVDALLAAFVAAGKASGTRVLELGGTGNATPSAAGLADKATLVSRGWTVTTN